MLGLREVQNIDEAVSFSLTAFLILVNKKFLMSIIFYKIKKGIDYEEIFVD